MLPVSFCIPSFVFQCFRYYIDQNKKGETTLTILSITVLFFVGYLIWERIQLNRRVQKIQLRICVTGTRGKSSVARLIYSVLRESGRKVVAKTTGSEAQLLLPDGSIADVHRRSRPSIIEQKNVIKTAVNASADCIVAEVMSIHPENHIVESQHILKPHIVIVTNVRSDHTDAMGKTEEEVAGVLALGIPEKAVLFILEKDNRPIFQAVAERMGAEMMVVRNGLSRSLSEQAPMLDLKLFSENLDLVVALVKHLNIDDKTVMECITKATGDIGSLKIWRHRYDESGKAVFFVNGFAANDPDSTWRVLEEVKRVLPDTSGRSVGLLSLRADRGDRTLQWLDALRGRFSGLFNTLYVTGGHANVFRKKVKGAKVLKNKSPARMTKTVMADADDGTVIFGFGNMMGAGRRLVTYWSEIGDAYGI
jgi:poly-gamma-glutamate synthase PgsB/CapB